MGVKIGYIGVGKAPKLMEIEPNENGSYLQAMQRLVGGYIEHFEVLYGTNPSLVINDNGIAECQPNRAVYATRQMEEKGFVSQFDFTRPVMEGELYALLFGPILAVSMDYNADGVEIKRDITDEEFSRLCTDFADTDSALAEIVKLKMIGSC